MTTNLFLNEQAKAMFNVRRQSFNKARAVREVAKRFAVSQAEVLRACFYW